MVLTATQPQCFTPFAQATPTNSLSDLRRIKQEWLNEARRQGIPALAWEVLRWLGEPVKHGMLRESIFYQVGSVSLIGAERGIIFSQAHGAFVERRSIGVYVARDGAPPPHQEMLQNPVDTAIMTGDQVMYWAWLTAESPTYGEVTEEDEGEDKDHLLFIPGQWTASILEAQPSAEAVARQHGMDSQEAERQQLLKQLLVGKVV